MAMKLSRQGAAEETEEEAPRKVVPKGWGKPAVDTDDEDEEDDVQTQKAAIKAKITKPAEPEEDEEEEEPAPVKAKKMFSTAVQKQLAEDVEAEDEEAPQIRKSPEDRKPVKATTPTKPVASDEFDTPASFITKGQTAPAAMYSLDLYVTAKQMEAIAKILQEV